MVYCGLVRPHRSVGGDQVTLTAPRVGSGANETMIGSPTAEGKTGIQSEYTNTITFMYLLFCMTYVYIHMMEYYSDTFAGSH